MNEIAANRDTLEEKKSQFYEPPTILHNYGTAGAGRRDLGIEGFLSHSV